MPAQRDPTLADYVVSILIPALIMALVGSLVFFLIELFYVGQYQKTILYIFFFFIFGSVLVSRMTLLYNLAHRAGLYGLALGLCAWLALQRYVTYPQDSIGASWGWALNLGFLTLTWWCTYRLTWDCTAGEDDPDPGGPGVLEAAQLSPVGESAVRNVAPMRETADKPVAGMPESRATSGKKRRRSEPALIAWWRRYQAYREEQRRRPRTLGVWVIYFSVMALLLFGLGHLAIPPEDQARRHYVFWLLVLYLASGLGLLLATCFLTVRRRLRQRQVRMPASLTALWLGCGAVFILLFLLLASGLPRPATESVSWQLPFLVTSEDLPASRWAPFQKEAGRGEGQPGPASISGATEVSPHAVQGQHHGSQEAVTENHLPGSTGSTDSANPPASVPVPKGAASSSSFQTPVESERDGQANSQPAPSSPVLHSPEQKTDKESPQKGLSEQAGRQPASSETALSHKREKDVGKSQKDQPGEADRQSQKSGQRPGSGPSTGSTGALQNQRPPAPPGAERHSAPVSPLPGLSWLLSLGPFVKKLLLILLALVVLFLLLRAALGFLANFTGWAQRLLAWLHALKALFQRRQTSTAKDTEAGGAQPTPPRTFEDFDDPFLTDRVKQMSVAELVRYSFAALEAWAEHCHLGRRAEETPLEFVERLAEEAPALELAARELVSLYTGLAYARRSLREDCRPILQRFWQTLRAVAEHPLSAAPMQ